MVMSAAIPCPTPPARWEGLHLPNMGKIGLGYITPMQGVPPAAHPSGAYGKMTPRSAGKDTISGHWEMMGVMLSKPLPTYPHGFPPEVIEEFEQRIGRGTLGNFPASGTEIIKQLGMEHIRTGKPIVYTSADSVFQIATNEQVIPIDQLYWMCEQAREMLTGDHAVGRVIARPFIGRRPGQFYPHGKTARLPADSANQNDAPESRRGRAGGLLGRENR